MVADIILRDLDTPEPVIKGTSAPLISTKADQRDGTRAGGGGGGGDRYDINNLTLVGLFRINGNMPGSSGVASYAYARGTLAHNPPNGSNGTFGSVFIDGRLASDGRRLAIGEYQIPEVLTDPSVTDPELIVSATPIQDYVDVQGILGAQNYNDSITAMIKVGNRLFMQTTNGYWNGVGGDMTNPEGIGVLNDPDNLDTTDGIAWGQMELKHAVGNDQGSTYFGEIPASLQATFGGNTHFCGNGYGMSRIERCSHGPSMLGFKPADYTVSGTLNYDEHINYPHGIYSLGQTVGVTRPEDYKDNSGFPEEWDIYNQTSSIHYLSFFGDTGPSVNVPGTTNPTWQVYEFYHGTDPRTAFSTLPAPSDATNDIWLRELSGVSLGFFVPGTKTFLVIGTMKGRRYGGGYKMNNLQQAWGAGVGGPQALDKEDYDIYFWAFDVDDIAAAANAWDVVPYSYGVLPVSAHKWNYYQNNDRITSRGGAFFDASTGRVYIPREKVKSSSHDAQTVVEVYQVAA